MSDPRGEHEEPPSVEDTYAGTYMKGASRVLLRDKTVGKKLLWLLGFVTLWCGSGLLATLLSAAGLVDVLPGSSMGVALFLGLMTAFFAFLTVTLTVVRAVVSEDEVHVQYGLWGPRVPVARIRRCRVIPYDWKKFGGWGIKRSADGTWAYVMSGGGDVVELSWTDVAGVDRAAVFSATDPRAVAAAIEEARAISSGVRVDTDDDRPAEEPVDDEASAQEEEATRRAR